MADLSNNSFIPKRGPVGKKKRGSKTRQVYVFTLFSYTLMFATLVATAGIFLYGNYVNQELNAEIAALNTEIRGFNESDMEKVLDLDGRLSQAFGRLENSASVVSVFEALEAATVDTVQIVSLILSRIDDDRFVLESDIKTDTFDSTIFQRGIYGDDATISNIIISDVQKISAVSTLATSDSSQSIAVADLLEPDHVIFKAVIDIPLSLVPVTPSNSALLPNAQSELVSDGSGLDTLIDGNLDNI